MLNSMFLGTVSCSFFKTPIVREIFLDISSIYFIEYHTQWYTNND